MTFAAALTAAVAPQPRRCIVGRHLDTLDPADAALVQQHLATGTSRPRLIAVLRDTGLTACASSFGNHARRECCCTTESETAE